MTPIDDVPFVAPPQATVRVASCVGCRQLPHGSVSAELVCLRATIVALRERIAGTSERSLSLTKSETTNERKECR